MTEFIGVIERNDMEGEKFGYYWENTPENEEGLRRLQNAYPDIFLGEEWGLYQFIFEPQTEVSLNTLNKEDENGYARRVQRIKDTDWDALCKEAEEGNDPLYKGRSLY